MEHRAVWLEFLPEMFFRYRLGRLIKHYFFRFLHLLIPEAGNGIFLIFRSTEFDRKSFVVVMNCNRQNFSRDPDLLHARQDDPLST